MRHTGSFQWTFLEMKYSLVDVLGLSSMDKIENWARERHKLGGDMGKTIIGSGKMQGDAGTAVRQRGHPCF